MSLLMLEYSGYHASILCFIEKNIWRRNVQIISKMLDIGPIFVSGFKLNMKRELHTEFLNRIHTVPIPRKYEGMLSTIFMRSSKSMKQGYGFGRIDILAFPGESWMFVSDSARDTYNDLRNEYAHRDYFLCKEDIKNSRIVTDTGAYAILALDAMIDMRQRGDAPWIQLEDNNT